jgi:excisionase family DNA binding protein
MKMRRLRHLHLPAERSSSSKEMKHMKRSPRSSGGAERRYLCPGEVARLFEVSPATIARWAREGRLPHLSTLGGHRRYLADEILAMVEKAAQPRWPGKNRRRAAL